MPATALSFHRLLAGLLGLWLNSAAALAATLHGQADAEPRPQPVANSRLELELLLLDPGAASRVLARSQQRPAGAAPWPIQLRIDDGELREAGSYLLRGALYHGEQLLLQGEQGYTGLFMRAGQPLQLRLQASSTHPDQLHGLWAGLPASFVGEQACADCPGERWQLALLEDGAYMLRRQRADQPAPLDLLGRWQLDARLGRVQLLADGQPGWTLAVQGRERLVLLDAQGQPQPAPLVRPLLRAPLFTPFEARLPLLGEFHTESDAPWMRLCASGQDLPVVPEAEHAALAAAHAASLAGDGARLLKLEGRIALRRLQAGAAPQLSLVVEHFLGQGDAPDCATLQQRQALLGPRWLLVQLGARRLARPLGQREAQLQLQAGGRLAGSDGCQRLLGEYRLAGTQLAFTVRAASAATCTEGAEPAEALRAALARTYSWRREGELLILLDEAGSELARLQAAR